MRIAHQQKRRARQLMVEPVPGAAAAAAMSREEAGEGPGEAGGGERKEGEQLCWACV